MPLELILQGTPGADLTFTSEFPYRPFVQLSIFTHENERAECELTHGQLIQLQNYLNEVLS